jgi:hypothetical protein
VAADDFLVAGYLPSCFRAGGKVEIVFQLGDLHSQRDAFLSFQTAVRFFGFNECPQMMLTAVQIDCPGTDVFIILDLEIDTAGPCFRENLLYLSAQFFSGCHCHHLL